MFGMASDALSRRKLMTTFKNMFGGDGVHVCDRRMGDKTFSSCFVGNEVVDWLMRCGGCRSRKEAAEFAQSLLDKGYIECADTTTTQSAFQDAFTFYRKTTRGDALSMTSQSRQDGGGGAVSISAPLPQAAGGSRSPLRRSRGDVANGPVELSAHGSAQNAVSPRMGRQGGMLQEEDASALQHLVTALTRLPPKRPSRETSGSIGVRDPSSTPMLSAATSSGGLGTSPSSSIPLSNQGPSSTPLLSGGSGKKSPPPLSALPPAARHSVSVIRIPESLSQPMPNVGRTPQQWRKSSQQLQPMLSMRDTVMEGWLMKQSATNPMRWKKRYLVLRGGKTVYSKVERGSDAEIPMDVVGSVRLAPEVDPLAFCIDAVTRSFVLKAENKDDLNEWVFSYHKAAMLVLDLLTEPGHVPRESRLRLQKWWKQRSQEQQQQQQLQMSGSSPQQKSPPKTPVLATSNGGDEAPTIETASEASDTGLECGIAWSMGRRPSMEDAHLVVPDLREECDVDLPSEDREAVFAVFDGHGGDIVAKRACALLMDHVTKQESFLDDLDAALAAGIESLDQQLCKECEELDSRGGSCAAVVWVRGRSLTVAHCGDCRVVLSTQVAHDEHVVSCLTRDHKPDRADEKARVEAAGGFVTVQTEPDLARLHRKTPAQLLELQRVIRDGKGTLTQLAGSVKIGRVMGTLSVSRALGDVGFKQGKQKMFGRKFNADLVISTPDVVSVMLPESVTSPSGRKRVTFAIIACDGLWDVITNEKACSIIRQLVEEGCTPRDAARMLVERAIQRGTLDNVTCIVVLFDRN